MAIRPLVIGSLLGVVFAGITSYTGHKAGIIDGGNIPAAILAFGILSAVLRRRPSIDEGNVVQTTSSSAAMMAITGGMIGPVAALVLAKHEPNFAVVVLWGIAVGVVGCMLAVPLRGAFITHGKLPFPSGAATAEVLETIYTGTRSAGRHLKMLGIGAGLAMLFAAARSLMGWIPEMYIFPVTIGAVPAAGIYLGVTWSPLLGGIGYLAGARTAVAFVVGTVLAWIVIAPQLVAAGIAEPSYESVLQWGLFVGTGFMIGGTIGPVIGATRGVRQALREVRDSQELRIRPVHGVLVALACGGVVAFGALAFDVNPIIPFLGLVLSVVFAAAAARANGETDNTPAGPLGGFTQGILGLGSPGIPATLAGGAVVGGTLMHSAMMLQNWRTGALVKTPPRTLFIAQLVGVVIGAVACLGAFVLITRAYGMGNEVVPAVVAKSWLATAEAVQHGLSAMPKYAPHAAGIAVVLGIVMGLEKVAKYAPSPIAIGMAFILPPISSLTIAFGGLVFWIVASRSKAAAQGDGMAVASGMIAGEALVGLVIASLIVAGVSVPL